MIYNCRVTAILYWISLVCQAPGLIAAKARLLAFYEEIWSAREGVSDNVAINSEYI